MSSVDNRFDGTTLVVRIPMRLQRRGRKLIATSGGASVPAAAYRER
jgi:hypothetical protein